MNDFLKLENMSETNVFDPSIRSIRFPRFKSISDHSELYFEFPITALVGPNGTNKSSILRALEACPRNRDISDHWFDTRLDNISASEGQGNPGRYIHSYRLPSGAIAEVIKTRVWKESRGQDYFETRAPARRDGMSHMPKNSPESDKQYRNSTRWKPIEKEVVYLDFRQELPAYDIFMSFNWRGRGRDQGNTPTSKKKTIRRRSPHVYSALSALRKEHEFYGHNRILEAAETLSSAELNAMSLILGRKYTSVSLVKHDYFDAEGYTAALTTAHHEYSEAYAGSGEFAAIMLVRAISRAEPRSLILLDEPETSLHPGAQVELMRFIARECVKKKHQVVLATHAQAIVEELPDKARKLLDISPATGKVSIVSQEASLTEAFSRIGAKFEPRTVLVEDELAKEFVLRAARCRGVDFVGSLHVVCIPGGASVMTHKVAAVQAELGSKCAMILDGDCRPPSPYSTLKAPAQVVDSALANELAKIGVSERALIRDGGDGNNAKQISDAQRKVYSWFYERVGFLPSYFDPDRLLARISGLNDDSRNSKEIWVEKTRAELNRFTDETIPSEETLGTQRRALASIPDDHSILVEILELLDRIL